MATYAVGDVQGCLAPLQELLSQVDFKPGEDQLWLAGDLVNRGPHSLETLRFVHSLGDSAKPVLGNHDLHLLAIAHGHQTQKRSDTLDDILTAPDCDTLLHWLRQQPILRSDTELGFTMTHAGIPPQWTLPDAQAYARELEEVLRSDNFQIFFANMYGNEPAQWDDHLEGWPRLRLITNYFTRMRFVSTKGQLELSNKQDPDHGPEGFLPWFQQPNRLTQDDKILFGHWASLEGNVSEANVYALDTGCVWGGCLSMLRLEDETWFRCQCKN